MAPVIEVSGLEFSWPGSTPFTLKVGSFALERGTCTLLLGPSGAGKSTLLALLTGIAVPQRGRIDILGRDIATMTAAERDAFRAEHIGVIFQMFNLLPYGSVMANVLLPLSFAPARRERATAGQPAEEEGRRLLGHLGLPQSLATSSAASSDIQLS
mgnify:CR=1 FL=1